ncbi:hypothetical protein Tco_0925929 [Tanacetum coccineum]|uniref:Uncharacterized protein n=1 Tax=Tanacetum coccineum TaxID=301880 RepID=A0ABQ5D8B5_9ASTR
MIVSYDKFALWGISHWGKKRRQFYAFATTRESARDIYSKRRIIAVTKVEIVKWQNYKHLDWITIRRDDDIPLQVPKKATVSKTSRPEENIRVIPHSIHSDDGNPTSANIKQALRQILSSKEATLQVVYDVLKLTPFYKAFQASADVSEIYMQEFWATASIHNRLIRFKMNNKKHIVNLEYFREMLQICPIIRNQKFDEPPFEQEILTFLGKSRSQWRDKKDYRCQCQQATSTLEIIYCGYQQEDFTYQVENKNTKKGNVMYYPCFTKLIVNFFMSKDPSIPRRNKINWHYARDDPMFTTTNVISRHEDTQLYGVILPKELTNEDIRNSESYKEYYAIASREVPLKTKASVHKKKDDSDTTPKKKPPTDPKDKRVKQTGKMTGSGMQKQLATVLETLFKIALTETKQLNIATKRSQIQTLNSQASSSGDGVDILSKVPDEQVHEKTGTDEGAGDKPEVPDVPEHHSESEEESWTFSDGDDDEDDDANKDSDVHDDNDAIESDDDDEQEEDEEEISDQLVRTPSDYQPTDESEKQKDDDRVKDGEEDKEGDETNVNLEGGDVDMTEADTTKDTEDAHVTLTAATPVVQQQSSSVSDLVSKFISPTTDEGIDSILTPHTELTTLVNVPISVATETPATTTTIHPPLFLVTQSSQQTPVTTTNPSTTPPPIPDFASVFGFNQRVTALESDLSKLKQSNPFAEAISSIPGIVNEYLGSKMKEAVDVAIQLKSDKIREEAQAENQEFLNSLDSHMQKIIKDQVKTQTSKIKSKVEKYVTESLGAEVLIRSTNQPQTSYGIASSLSELELKRILMDKMEENKSIDRSDVQKNLYNTLVEAYNTDKDLLSSYVDVIILPITSDDKDTDEEPSTGLNRGTKRWRSSKEVESSKELTRKESRTTSVVPIDYDKHAYWGKLTNLSLDDRYALNVALRMYTQRIVIQERVEDLQLAVESYQKKINLTGPDTTRLDLRKMTPYTGYPDVQGIIYQDKLSRNWLMRTDELHKFSDGTLNHVRTTLNDIATGIQMDYFLKRRWSPQDKRRARVMISAIDRKLRD